MNIARLIVAFALFSVLSLGAKAGSVRYVKLTADDELLVAKERLVSSFKYNLAGAQRYAARQTTLQTPEDFELFAREYAGATIAHMEYRWHNARGQPRTTLYHALSGKTPPGLMPARSGARPPSPYTWPEWQTYLPDSGIDIYAHIPEGERSILEGAVHADPRPGVGRSHDAEMRGLRTIERDIVAGNLTDGGRLVAWVSKPPCPACREAMRLFAESRNVDITVYHLPPPEEFTRDTFRLTQMTQNRMTRHFHQRVANYRDASPRVPCRR